MLTSKGKYGLKALVHLARLEGDEMAQSAAIAAANNISKKFLDAILGDLRNAGLVRTRKGPGGGYALAKPADYIMVGDAVRALDGPLAPIACASRKFYEPCADCRDVAACEVRLVMSEARNAMADVLDRTSIAAMSRASKGGMRSVSGGRAKAVGPAASGRAKPRTTPKATAAR